MDFSVQHFLFAHASQPFAVEGRVLEGIHHCLLAIQAANPSSRRKEKASKTEKILLAHLA
jgi:hypothetical protein